MATFKFSRDINIHWNGYDVKGPADTVFSIPDQLYEEFESDIRGVEPSLTWIDTNEFQTLKDSVPSGTYVKAAIGQNPISVSTSSSTATISLNSGTALNGYLLVADGTGGTIWNPASTSGLTSVVGISPISTTISGGTVSVSLTANYQTAGSYQPAGTYVNAVIGTSPASVVTASGTSTVSIDQAAITGATSANNAQVVRFYVKNATGSTIDAGKAVYVSGATGDNALISLASATSDPTSSKTLGLTLTSIANDALGYVVEAGYITGIDTTGVSAGSSVWLGNTPGSLVYTAPPAEPSHAVYLGVVVREQQNNGSILVKVQNGYELNELHDVFTTGVSTSLPLVYNAASDGWIAQALSSVGIADNAIVASKIAASQITSGHILTGAVGSAALADGAVVSAAVAANAITSGHIATGAVGSAQIAAGAVVAGDIAANAVTSGNIAAGAVGTAAISSGAATSGQLLQATGTGAAIFATIPPGVTVNISEFTATGTWTKPAGVSAVYVWLIGAGAGGPSGARATGTGTLATSGNAGGGAGQNFKVFNASILPSTVTVTIGAGGAGGIGVSAGTTAASSLQGANGGRTYFGVAGNEFLAGGEGTSGGAIPRLSPAYWSVSAGGSLALNDLESQNNGAADVYNMAQQGALAASVTNTTTTASILSGTESGGRGFGYFYNIVGATAGTVGGNGGNATDGFGNPGGAGGSNNTASGLASGNGGNGGNGFRGGGGGAGGNVWASSGAARNQGSGGSGGDGYALVISW